jgi:hypothetical protein
LIRYVSFFAIVLLLLQPPIISGEISEEVPEIIALQVKKGEISIDGRLDEPSWQRANPAIGFIQREPNPGEPATEPSEVRILFDEESLYIGAILYDSAPEDIVADEMKRDADLRRNDAFAVLIDTYHDHRNGFFFETNPLGAKADAYTFNEGKSINFDWDGIWWVEVSITPKGWQVEMKIPFSTLRYDEERLKTWGIQFRRIIRRKNEEVYWSFVPLEASIWRVSKAGHLKGLKEIRQEREVEIKPYLIFGAERMPSKGEDEIEPVKDAGVDIKYSITPNLTLDITFNTDFAHVEVDEQQINITRFPLFFPEKRDFFLEGGGFFDFGLSGKIQPFFSRRIGLVSGEEIPILLGGKLTGKEGKYGIGFLSIQTRQRGEEPETNYTVIRLKRDILTRSNIGLIAVNKEPSGKGFNRTFGIDAKFSLFEYLDFIPFFFKTLTQGPSGDGEAGYIKAQWEDESKLLTLSYLDISEDINPEVGFVKRKGIKETLSHLGWRFRPIASKMREVYPFTVIKYTLDQEDTLVTRSLTFGTSVEFHSGDSFNISYKRRFERLNEEFEISPGIVIPIGGYSFDSIIIGASTDKSRKISGDTSFSKGEFYNGNIVSYEASLFLRPSTRLGFETKLSRNEIDLPQGFFITNLITARAEYNFSTRVFFNALLQWNDDTDEFISNLRFNYEYRPGSDIFLVFNETRDLEQGFTDYSLLFKLTYLLSL